nr:RNA-directed DNA polymerase, eukaryota [Tanacetum cinerariifolium]
MSSCPNISAITLDRDLSDHGLILMCESHYNYRPVPFRFFQYWFEIEGFYKLVEESWKEAPVDDINALIKMMKKLKYLKEKTRVWNKLNKESPNNSKTKLKAELAKLDSVIDKDEAKIKWAIEGDENSKYYHGILNKKRSQLDIRGILVDDNWIDSPGLVKSEFLYHFKKRFDQPQETRLHLGMNFLNNVNSNWQANLECEVTKYEIKRAIIESDVLDAVTCFFHQGYFSKGRNSSFITLIAKTPDANTVKDFRPISLIRSIYKIITKILVNHLEVVLRNLVNEVQSAFVADRQILDGLFILNKLFQWCKSKKKQSLVFKVDFEKAYDSVRWDYLDDILRKFNFREKWCARVVDAGMFNGITLGSSLLLSHMFYADDAIFMGQWLRINMSKRKLMGIRINMSKRKPMGIYVDADKVDQAARKIDCVALKTPFTYLGSKVGGLMSRIQSWNETVEGMVARLSK